MLDDEDTDRLQHQNEDTWPSQRSDVSRLLVALRQSRESTAAIERMLSFALNRSPIGQYTEQELAYSRRAVFGTLTQPESAIHCLPSVPFEQRSCCCSGSLPLRHSWPEKASCHSSATLHEACRTSGSTHPSSLPTTLTADPWTAVSKLNRNTALAPKHRSDSITETRQETTNSGRGPSETNVTGTGVRSAMFSDTDRSVPELLPPNEVRSESPQSVWSLLEPSLSSSDVEHQHVNRSGNREDYLQARPSGSTLPLLHTATDMPTIGYLPSDMYLHVSSRSGQLVRGAQEAPRNPNRENTVPYGETLSSSLRSQLASHLHETASSDKMSENAARQVIPQDELDLHFTDTCLLPRTQHAPELELPVISSPSPEQKNELKGRQGSCSVLESEPHENTSYVSSLNSSRDEHEEVVRLTDLIASIGQQSCGGEQPLALDTAIASLTTSLSGRDTIADVQRGEDVCSAVREGEGRKKRKRRASHEVVRKYKCAHPGCSKAYGKLHHLNDHIARLKHGPKRFKRDFEKGRSAESWLSIDDEEEALALMLRRVLRKRSPAFAAELQEFMRSA